MLNCQRVSMFKCLAICTTWICHALTRYTGYPRNKDFRKKSWDWSSANTVVIWFDPQCRGDSLNRCQWWRENQREMLVDDAAWCCRFAKGKRSRNASWWCSLVLQKGPLNGDDSAPWWNTFVRGHKTGHRQGRGSSMASDMGLQLANAMANFQDTMHVIVERMYILGKTMRIERQHLDK